MPDLDDPNHSISFDADTIANALVNIYQKKYGNGKEIEPTLFEKTKEIFESAINKGVKQSSFSIDTAFKHQLTHNMWVFSAFRTHKMQRDIAKYLLNEKGELKPFTKFVKDVAPYIKHTNRLWLETEYNTAVLRAHQAADWRKFVDERDVLPNLEWQPSTSTNPGEDHRPYWFTCLPIDHKFWKQHRPGDRWNCKCSLRNTDKEPTPVPADTIIKGSEPQRGLESNPGEKGEIFSNNHPYYPENCGVCPFNKGVGKLFAALVGGKRNCNKCNKPITKSKVQAKLIRQQITEKIKKINEIIENPHKGIIYSLNNFITGKTCFRRSCLPDVLTHQIEDTNVKTWIIRFKPPTSFSNFNYEGWAYNRLDEDGTEKHKDCYGFLYYSLSIKGQTYWANIKAHKSYGEVLYTIEKKKPADLKKGYPDFLEKIKE